jgi:hypothetical protein
MFCGAARALLVVAVTALGACSEQAKAPSESPIKRRLEHALGPRAAASSAPDDPPPVDHTRLPVSDVAFKWPGAKALNGAAFRSSQSLSAELTNQRDKDVAGRIMLVAQGLDGRKIERVLEKFAVPAGARREIALPLGKLPIQSEVSLSFVALVAEVERPKGVVRITTPPLYYQFRNGYQEALVYNAAEVAKIPFPTTQNMMDVQGRIVEEDGTVTDAAELSARKAEETSKTDQGYQGLSTFGTAPVDPFTKRSVLPFPAKGVPPAAVVQRLAGSQALASPALVNANVTVCSTWNVQYVDSDASEDYFNTDDWMWQSASQTFAYIFDGSWGLKWMGNLDGYGCAWSVSLEPGNYFMFQVTENTQRGSKMFHALDHGSAGWVATWFTVYPLTGWVNLYPSASNAQIQAAAVNGYVLAMDAWTPGGLGLVDWTYPVNVNEGCASNNPAACYGNPNTTPPHGGVFLGVTDPEGIGEEHWKHIIAHEIGHFAQDIAMGMHQRSYSDFAISEPTCMCDFFNPDELHCIQSREDIGAAQIEGFAHAFASRVFNWAGEANGTFVYYKPFLDDGLGSNPPPQAFSTFYPDHWMENHCPDANRGIEMDWMTFYFNAMSFASANETSTQDLFSIYRRACTGDPNSNCSHINPMPWTTLDQNAQTHYGGSSSDPRYVRFRDTAFDTGVAW